MRSLAADPLCYRPWEVGKLTPFQVHEVLRIERDKQGHLLLEPPMGDDEADLTIESEWRAHFLRAGVTDPDALRMLVAEALDEEVPATEPAAEDEDE